MPQMRGRARLQSYTLLAALAVGLTSASMSPAIHPSFSAVLRSRSLERFEPKVLEDTSGMRHISDLPRTGLDSVLRVAASNVGLQEVYAGKCLVPPPGVPGELKDDNVIRFEDPQTGSDVSVWFRPLFADSDHKVQKGLLIDGIFSRRNLRDSGSKAEAAWKPLVMLEARKSAETAASPFAWWRATLRGIAQVHSADCSTVSNLITDVECAFKEAINP